MTTPRETPFLIGHDAAEAAILEAMRGGRLHHAWLLTGPEGIGKATLAYRFARRLLAGGSASLEMAPEAPVFRRVAAGTHADLLTVEREWDEKRRRLKKQIAAETARAIPPFLHLTPAEGGWRVVIVDGAEDLNAQSANALLKILEEPPRRAVLILVCSAAGRLLPTLRSRCRHLKLAPLPDLALSRVLARALPGMGEAERAGLIRLAAGSPGRALALAEEDGLRIAAMVDEVLAAGSDISLLRGYEMSDALREQAAFGIFMDLLRRGIAEAVGAAVRGTGTAVQARFLVDRPAWGWAELEGALARLQDETERANMDRRQAVIAGLALLRAA